MAYPTELRIQTTASGARRLRFTTMIVNIGDGPFETRSSRLAGNPTMGVNQRIYNSAGGYRVFDTTATAKYSGDGHDHWHVQDVARYELFAINGKGPALRRDAKVGFCFFDTNAYRLSLPRAPRVSGVPGVRLRNPVVLVREERDQRRLGRQIRLAAQPPVDLSQQPAPGRVLPEGDRRSALPVPGDPPPEQLQLVADPDFAEQLRGSGPGPRVQLRLARPIGSGPARRRPKAGHCSNIERRRTPLAFERSSDSGNRIPERARGGE